MFTPFIVQISTRSHQDVGKNSGQTYALSTLGGIIGTFVTGLYLLPQLGIKWTIITGAITLLIVALPAVLSNWKFYIFSGFCVLLSSYKASAKVYQTPYGQVEILDNDGIRHLKINDYSSAAEPNNGDSLVYRYIQFFKEVGGTHPNPKKALMIGGSICSLPNYMIKKNKSLTFDIVEPDKKLIEIALEEFSLKNHKRLHFHYDDGRYYLRTTEHKYDLIYIDAFTSKTNIPFQLCTKEAVSLYAEHLNINGFLIFNIVCTENNTSFLDLIHTTYSTSFENVRIYDLMPYEHDEAKSWTLIASNHRLPIFKETMYHPHNQHTHFTDDWVPVAWFLE
jgi:spermidine synthase